MQGTLKEGDKLKVYFKEGSEGLEIKATKPKAIKAAKAEADTDSEAGKEGIE